MASSYEYILSLSDKVTGTMKKITGGSVEAMDKFSELNRKTKTLQSSFNDFGGSVSSLRQKIDLLRQERDLINPKNLTTIRQYNSEIKKLTKEVERLETINGSRLKNWTKDAYAQMPAIAKNPLLLGAAAIGFSSKNAVNFDEGMSKVNITAQLDPAGRAKLADQLKQLAINNRVDISTTPVGFEKILSQIGDVERSLPIMDAAIKGSKAGFVDLDTVAGALAQTMSIVGSQASAMEVLDTFFAAKRVGAGEFSDFANYMPNLIAGADALGIKYKEVAGIFSYMTGKGQSAEKASVLMANMFSVMGRGEIRDKLNLAGIKIFDDKGKIRDTISIFTDMKKVIGGFSDEQKSSFLEKMGIVDKEAKNSIAVMLSDIDKLKSSIDQVNDSAGETDKTLALSRNTMMKATEAWTSFKNLGFQLGGATLPLINIALDSVVPVINIIAWIISQVNNGFSWFNDMLQQGDPLIWGLIAAGGALTTMLLLNEIVVNRLTIATKAKALMDAVATGATTLWTWAVKGLNAAFIASPIGWIAAAFGVLTGAVIWAWQKFEGFRQVVLGTWEVMKMFGSLLVDSIFGTIKNLLGGIGSLGAAIWKLFTGDFKGAAEQAKQAATQIFGANPIVAGVKLVGSVSNADFSGAWQRGRDAGSASWRDSQAAGATAPLLTDQGAATAATLDTAESGANFKALMNKIDGGKKKGSGSKGSNGNLLDLTQIVSNMKGSTAYSAIASRLSHVAMPSVAAATAAIALPASIEATSLPQNDFADPGKTEYVSEKGMSRTITMDKFCESVIINVQNGNGVDAEKIADVIMVKIKEAMDDYEA